ncbi:xanthine dehydrogenase small subunit [Methylophaga sp.]|uniref:xanthine dehydrogenase small subunit n=1 Tax=Methylophaga sp. TaxID=2024840 RepID=UPI002716337B|nr:xanthine dehydrogenase small subunit [Methylophaga sp.]MDO8826853.1 xanthine dehydrogenase small subunit [Methylophaga sp.]
MIKFMLNGEWVTESDIDPTLSVLRYLRTKKGLTGTKEGCASGDCGACTLLIGEVNADRATYKAVNSCITLLGDLHGKHIVSVEGVNASAEVHPVQACMVEHHGSQCGFCTPGIVMSLVGLREKQQSCSRADALEALSGNLCRCTGYRPIVDAALASFQQSDVNNVINATTAWQIPELESCASLQSEKGSYFAPQHEAELKTVLAENPQARFVAGATDLALDITQQYKTFDCLVSLSNVAELSELSEAGDVLNIGGAATYSAVMPWLKTWYPQVVELFDRIGSLQIRNRGTIGGNVANASPIGDTPPILLALGASLELATVNSRRLVAIDDFFKGYKQTVLKAGEYIRTISIPKPKADTQLKLYKVSKRYDDDISAVMAAFFFKIEQGIISEARLAFGGMAAIPKYAESAQASLIGKAMSADTLSIAMAALNNDFAPMTDVRATDKYRLKVAQNLLQKAFAEINESMEIGVFHYA